MKYETVEASKVVDGKKVKVGELKNVPFPESLKELAEKADTFGGEAQALADHKSGYTVRIQRGIRPTPTLSEQDRKIVNAVKAIKDADTKALMEKINIGLAKGEDVSELLTQLQKLAKAKAVPKK